MEAGTGEGLIAEAAAFLGMECVRISERYGREISDVFPAYAVARLGGDGEDEIQSNSVEPVEGRNDGFNSR